MTNHTFEFSYEVYTDSSELKIEDAELLQEARKITENAYAPYSKFQVGAVALLSNGEKIAGTNQENAAYPVGTCAERVLLGTVATLHPEMPIETLALSYQNDGQESDHPISPCGMCRQALLEYENRTSHPIRLLLSGQKGIVYLIKTVKDILPFAFTQDELK